MRLPKEGAAQKKKKLADVDRRFNTASEHYHEAPSSTGRDALIEVLHIAQEAFGYLEEDVLE